MQHRDKLGWLVGNPLVKECGICGEKRETVLARNGSTLILCRTHDADAIAQIGAQGEADPVPDV